MKYKFNFIKNKIMPLGLIGIIIVFLVWEIIAELKIIEPVFISSPSRVLTEIFILFNSGFIYEHLLTSLIEFSLGFLLAFILGVFLGFTFGWYKKIYQLTKPLTYALYATPFVAILPLIVIWFGVGLWPKVAIIFLASVFPILINITEAVRNINPDLLRLAKSFRATDLETLINIAFPYCFPSVISGIRNAVPRGIIGMIVAEFFLGNSGVGYLISYYGATFQTAKFLAVVLLIVSISIFINLLIDILEKKLSISNYKFT